MDCPTCGKPLDWWPPGTKNPKYAKCPDGHKWEIETDGRSQKIRPAGSTNNDDWADIPPGSELPGGEDDPPKPSPRSGKPPTVV